MTQQSDSDKAKWDALAEMLGAKINQVESSAPPRKEAKVAPRVHLDLPPPPRKHADWDSLASDLGAKEAKGDHPSKKLGEGSPGSSSQHPPRKDRAFQEEREKPPHDPPTSSGLSHAREDEVITESADRLSTSIVANAEDVSTRDQVSDLSDLEERQDPGDRERRPPRRRRRRGQRQGDDAGGERPVRRDRAADSVEEQKEDVAEFTQRDKSDRRGADGGAKRAGHKSVPSWSEAISLMIDGNLANRSTRRRTGANGGRARGRRGSRRS